ncbi:hypothetical protein [Streptomyces sp. TRM75563]|uniref:hypothetical protein n=1 Tax=Streptomyces sp. TRM75563 TaxID=2817418 RepID=UPI001F612FA5|nr:hypothetical protein [Streptomyces sp. TRM75563]MCI4045809.1 hypothetical protein [Streptomyces sp. TRM75563]
MRRSNTFVALATAVSALGSLLLLSSSPATAATPTSYESDACTSSGNRYCFAVHYNSRGAQTWYSGSPCFVANKDIPDYYGYSPNGAVLVRYVFRPGQISGTAATCVLSNDGDGKGVKNNAASASNGECSATYRVYVYSGYGGPSQAFLPNCGDYWPSDNLVSTLKNNNASHDRY